MAVEHQTNIDLDAFRVEVRGWLAAHSNKVGGPVDAADLTREQFLRNRAFLRKLGTRGWYAPGWPVAYGGGGLPVVAREVIREELERLIPHVEHVHPLGDIGYAVASALWLLGTEEQKRRFLPPVLRAEVTTWELYTEPEAGSDLPSLKTRAVRQGDSYILSGTKTLVGGHFEPDQHFVLAVTDPQGRRHENLSAFIVPADTPGITITSLPMIAGSLKRTIVLDSVVVPAANRIGNEGDGWRAFNSRPAGDIFGPVGLSVWVEYSYPQMLAKFLHYVRKTERGGMRLIDRPDLQTVVARAWMDGEVLSLLQQRNARMVAEEQPFTYEGAQCMLYLKLFGLRLSEAIQRALGPIANIADPLWAPEGGEFEYFHRYALLNAHPGGTCEIQKLRMFRGMVTRRAGLEDKETER